MFAAPSNAAIAKLPSYVVNYFTAPENAALLKGLLEYHIANALINVTNVIPNQKIATLQGSNIFVEYVDGKIVTRCVISRRACHAPFVTLPLPCFGVLTNYPVFGFSCRHHGLGSCFCYM